MKAVRSAHHSMVVLSNFEFLLIEFNTVAFSSIFFLSSSSSLLPSPLTPLDVCLSSFILSWTSWTVMRNRTRKTKRYERYMKQKNYSTWKFFPSRTYSGTNTHTHSLLYDMGMATNEFSTLPFRIKWININTLLFQSKSSNGWKTMDVATIQPQLYTRVYLQKRDFKSSFHRAPTDKVKRWWKASLKSFRFFLRKKRIWILENEIEVGKKNKLQSVSLWRDISLLTFNRFAYRYPLFSKDNFRIRRKSMMWDLISLYFQPSPWIINWESSSHWN